MATYGDTDKKVCFDWFKLPAHPVVRKAVNSGGLGAEPQKDNRPRMDLGNRFVALTHTKQRIA